MTGSLNIWRPYAFMQRRIAKPMNASTTTQVRRLKSMLSVLLMNASTTLIMTTPKTNTIIIAISSSDCIA